MKTFLNTFCVGFLVFLAGCNMEKEIELNLPEFQSEIAVECYLIDGRPYRATIMESTSYFDRPEPIIIPDAVVIITHNGQADTLQYRPGFDKETERFFTHSSEKLVIGNPGDMYSLEVFDARGRKVTGTTRFMPVVPIDSLELKYNNQSKVALLTTFTDEGSTEDFYRYTVHKDSLSSRKRQSDFESTDRIYNGQKYAFGSSYRYDPKDTLFVTLYHIEPKYYDFLNTLDAAQDANGNPFAQPIALKSTVQGGIGVFTALVYDRRRIIID